MQIGNKEFQTTNKTYVMGILNVTPDSFSDGGQYQKVDLALKHVEKMVLEGADIIDIGGESTRPSHTPITEAEEIERVMPVIEGIKSRFDIPISLDTYKPAVAKAGIDAGIDFINDIWGLQYDEEMATVIAGSKLPCCLMHNRKEATYTNFMRDIESDFGRTIQLAQNAGIENDKIILDPGIGFGKSQEQNLFLLNSLQELYMYGYPLLLGVSRKSVIGNVLNLPVEDRLEGTLATTVLAVIKGCMFIRVHDIEANVRAIQMMEAILGAKG